MLRPFASLREGLLVCRSQWFVIDWSVRGRAGDGIEKTLEHADHGRHLARGQLLESVCGRAACLLACIAPTNILHARESGLCP